MPANISADKTLEQLLNWAQTDPLGLIDYTFELQAEVRRLRDAAALNSRNSSLAPSTDRAEPPQPQSLRKASGRKPGGQPGHPGRTLQFRQDPDDVQIHPALECACGEDLSKEPALDYERRQVFDLPPLQLQCLEHRAEIKECPCCHQTVVAAFPDDCQAPVQYGQNLRALLTYLYDAQVGASLRISQMCAEMFGYAVSEATLQSARQETYQALEPFENRLLEILPQEPVLHADETSVRINKVNHWLHVLCTPLLSFFAIHAKRGQKAIYAIGIIPQFTGWLMTDFLSSYLSFDQCRHTFCKSHLLRELIFLFEQHQQKWAQELHDLFLEMLEAVRPPNARDAPIMATEKEYHQWRERYGRILQAGREANPLNPAQKANPRAKRSKEQNLLERLESYDDCILAFLWAVELPFTNNEGERTLRMMKVRMKISGCFRTVEGARRHARIRSYISTLRKRGLPVLKYLRRALDGRPFLPQALKST